MKTYRVLYDNSIIIPQDEIDDYREDNEIEEEFLDEYIAKKNIQEPR